MGCVVDANETGEESGESGRGDEFCEEEVWRVGGEGGLDVGWEGTG